MEEKIYRAIIAELIKLVDEGVYVVDKDGIGMGDFRDFIDEECKLVK